MVESGVTPILHYDLLGRLIRTDLPNGSYSKVEFDPWTQTTWDPNDTVFDPADPDNTRPLWYESRHALPPGPEHRAATLTAAHAGTTTIAELDALGRIFRTTEDDGTNDKPTTTQTLDIEGNLLALTDARGMAAMTQVFAMGGRKLKQTSVDTGMRWMLTDVMGQPLRSWDSRGHALRYTYDALRRPLELFVTKDTGPEILAERTVWGEGHLDAVVKNLRGQAYQRYDGAGVITSETYDFKGNLLASSRRLRSAYATQVDWPFLGLTEVDDIVDAAEPLLELESFQSSTAYDALNRPTSITAPDASEIRPTYNEAGLLEAVDVRLRGGATWNGVVDDIDYDAKGQRERIVYGNGTRTEYTYDPLTFRLIRLKTTRDADSAVLQNLAYTYDPIGNILAVEDAAQQTVFFDNAVVTPSALYEYDPLYRLIEATGREHAGGLGDNQRDQNDLPLNTLPHANDAQALRNYAEGYAYDKVGNILQIIHNAGGPVGSWTRGYRIADTSNRLEATSLQGDDLEDPESSSAEYTHDAHGNMVAMPHLAEIGWDFKDQLVYADKGGGGEVHFTYDAAGQRVRKVWEHAGLIEERIYLGGWEVYRRRVASSGVLELERETLHLMDGAKRVVMIETKTVDTSDPVLVVTPRFRYQLGNHLGSALLEVDETGSVISYEEYHPYGTTAYRSGRSGVEVSAKRYRYTGKERDEETGLYYHGARYYACWLGRWTAADPAGMVDGTNLYAYVRGSPVGLVDPSGRESAAPRLTEEQIARLKANPPASKIPYGASVKTMTSVGKGRWRVDTSRYGGASGTRAALVLPDELVLVVSAAQQGVARDASVQQGLHGPGGIRGGTTLGDGMGHGPGSTALDDVTAIGGALGMQMPDAAGASGGIPGGMGPASGANALGQTAWLAVSFLWGKAVQGAKALAKEAVPLAKTVASKVDRLVGSATTARAVERGVEKARAGVDQVAKASPAAGGAARAFGGLSRGVEFGLKPYGQLRQAIQGTGLQAHHLIEQRFSGLFGSTARSEGLSVAVTQAEHQAFTNAWRARIPYGPSGTGAATRESVLEAAHDVYRNYPEILRGLGL